MTLHKVELMQVKLSGNFEDIKLFKIHADYRPLNMQKTTNYYYVYGWKKSEVGKYFRNKVPWLKIFNIEVCSDEERKLQEEKPPEKKIIMNESNYLRIKEYLEKNNEK